jgi:hypothetical protein
MSTEKSPYSQLRKPRTRHTKHFFSKKTSRYELKRQEEEKYRREKIE